MSIGGQPVAQAPERGLSFQCRHSFWTLTTVRLEPETGHVVLSVRLTAEGRKCEFDGDGS